LKTKSKSLQKPLSKSRASTAKTSSKNPAPRILKDNTVVVRNSKTELYRWIRPFRMARNLVTIEEWNAVRNWALKKGYDLPELPLPNTANSSPKDPATSVTVRKIARWCNAKSEQEGLEPCYTVEGKVFKSEKGQNGIQITRFMDWNPQANGYRLATEAEWLHAMFGHKKPPRPIASAGSKPKGILQENIVPDGNEEDQPNSIGIRDICNYFEWVWELVKFPQESSEKSNFIGSSHRATIPGHHSKSKGTPVPTNAGSEYIGFRLARNIK